MSVGTYRKKPVEIEAFLYSTEGQLGALVAWSGGAVTRTMLRDDNGREYEGLPRIMTLEGELRIEPVCWVIRGVEGEYYPCAPSVFDATYERVFR